MKRLLFILLIIHSFTLAGDTTYVSGSVNGVWSNSASPYIVTSNLIIQPDDTLIIQPGVTVLFEHSYRVDVFGLLKADGTEQDSITFTKNTGTYWGSINFADDSNDSSSLSYCNFRYGSESGYDPYFGTVNCNHSNPSISNSTFDTCSEIAIYLKNSNAVIINNTFKNLNYSDNIYSYSSFPTIANNLFTESMSSSNYFNIHITNSFGSVNGNDTTKVRILNNEFSNNHYYTSSNSLSGTGLHIKVSNSGYIEISGNIFYNNSAHEYGAVYYSDTDGVNIIKNNKVYDNEMDKPYGNRGLIYCNYGDDYEISNNEIYNNYLNYNSSDYSAIYMKYVEGNAMINRNLIYNNYGVTGIYLYNLYSNQLVYNNTVDNNNYGLIVNGSSGTMHAKNNSVTNNTYTGINGGSLSHTVKYNNSWNNNNGNNNYQGGPNNMGNLVNININGNVADVYDNISENPLYMNPASSNYSLQSNSPNINAGDPNFDSDPDGSIIDIGKFYFIPLPALEMQPSELDIERIDVGSIYSTFIDIINPGDSTLDWSVTGIDSSWLYIADSDTSGNISASDTFALPIVLNVSELDADNYSTQIHFQTNDPNNQILDYNVFLRIADVWEIDVTATIGTFADSNNVLGMDEDASSGYDEDLDLPDPPSPPSDYIQLAFVNTDWSSEISLYTNDIREHRDLYGPDVEIWEMQVYTDSDESSAILSFDSSDNFPEGYTYWVIIGTDTTDVTNTGSINLSMNDGVADFSVMVKGIIPPSPVVSIIDPEIGSAYMSGDNINILWTLQNDAEYFDLFYSTNGGESYSTIVGNIDSDIRTYNWNVPGSYTTELYIRLDAHGPGETFGQNILGPLAVIPENLYTTLYPGWNLFALEVMDYDPSFNGDLYLYSFDINTGYSLIDDNMIEPRYGYWGAVFEQMNYSVTYNTLITTDIILDQGWNLIGSSQPFDVDTMSIEVVLPYDSLNNVGGDTMSFTNAISEGHISTPALYYWENGSYTTSNKLKRSHGHWISSATDALTLLIPPDFMSSNQQRSSGRTALDETNWEIAFNIEIDGISDMFTKLGVKEDAIDDYDLFYDLPAPPTPPGGNYIQGYFQHPDWNVITGSKFNTDYVEPIPLGEDQEWHLTINGETDSDIILSWLDGINNIPNNYNVTLEIVDSEQVIDMLSTNSLTLSYTDLPIEVNITVNSSILGIGDNLIPNAFALYQNYPNPFNPVTSLRYDLPEDGLVNITIYDMMGRKVKTLVNDSQTAGYKSIRWNATNNRNEPVSAGLYLYTIQAGEFRQTRKMVLLK